MSGSIWDWSATASANGNADDDINWSEGQAPSTVNNSARVMMQRLRELLNDLGGVTASTNTANAYALTASSAFTEYADGVRVSFRASATNTGNVTLNVNTVGTKPVKKISTAGEVDVSAGEIQLNGIYELVYSTILNAGNGAWLLLNPSQTATLIGEIKAFGGTDLPDNYLWCDGAAVSRTDFAALFDAIGTSWGNGDGTSTFNKPDFRGRVIAGKDDMGGTAASRLTSAGSGIDGKTLGASGGDETHTLTTAEMPAHRHTGTTNAAGSHSHTVPGSSGTGGSGAPSGNASPQFTRATSTAGNHSHSFTTSTVGSTDAHNNVQPTAVSNFIIRYQ